MKKLTLFFLFLLALGLSFQACDDTKTYAEMLEDEKKAIDDFIRKNNIKVITQTEFYAQDSTTNVDKNEYVQLASGVYMQIVKEGVEDKTDTIKNNDLILVRFVEYNLLRQDTTLSNLNDPDVVDEFKYTISSTSISGIFTQGYMLYYGTSVPAGWLVPLVYIRNRAHVKLIVPSKMGQQDAMQSVYPCYYDIRKYQIWQ